MIGSSPESGLLLILGFFTVVTILLYIFRDKTTRLPETTKYNYETRTSNPKINEQITGNAYLRTLAPGTQSIAYNIHKDKQSQTNPKPEE